MKKSESRTVFFVALGLSLCCLLAVALVIGYVYVWPQLTEEPAVAQAQPSVLFTSPRTGDQVAVGEPVAVHAVARGSTRIARVELWIDGQLHAAQDSTLPGGSSPFPLVSFWEPAAQGQHTLVARAIDAVGTQAQAAVDVTAAGGNDRDGDGLPDESDACPDQPGVPSAEGCPDQDGDGVPDSSDLCPEEPGAGTDGCPAPAADDRDGDGVPDAEDTCPDEPGLFGSGCPLIGDRDGDEVLDPEDACPDVPGSPATGGCPDRDGDGVPDGEDACPDEPGPFEGSCPAPPDADRDGDGLADEQDMCPDEPGPHETGGCPDRDGDGLRDSEDGCPDEVGPAEHGGCPGPGAAGPGGDGDSDGDGIAGDEDACPGAAGLPELEGCPDRDGDGVPDYRDMCPDEAGPAEALGCPGATADRDGDGVPDDADSCPEEAGQPENEGCPSPTEDEEPMGDSFGDIEGQDDSVLVEFQALSFQVGNEYDGVYCYPSLAGGPVERYSFEPSGAQQWDIVTPLGSRQLLARLDRPIAIQVECGADVIFMGDGSGWGTYWRLGAIEGSHPTTDWDGHVITARSSGGDEERWFEVQYRLCSGSCDDTAFPPPRLTISHGRDHLLIWQWDGDMDRLSEYSIYVDGSRVTRIEGTSNIGTMDVGGHAPLCGGQREFYVVARGADGRQSPASNVVTWAAAACPRVVRVTFDQLSTFETGDEEDGCLGPIFGSFWVEGSESQSLTFEGDDYPNGFRLCPNNRYNIQEMFDTIWRWGSGIGSSPYWAPASSSVTVELGPEDDLTLGGVIYEWDRSGTQHVYREAFMRSLTRPANQVHPGRYALRSGEIRLEFVIDVLVGPEAGSEPDLTISSVDRHDPSGQLRVHVFNNASDMATPADITVHWVRVGSAEVVGTQTWQDVQIPSGGSRILQTSDPIDEIGGMLFTLDPDLAIPDGDRGNNTYETPIRMRVEFLGLSVPECPCEGFLEAHAEFYFRLYAGQGPSADQIEWSGHAHYPESGEVRLAHSQYSGERDPWILEGDGRYAFDIEVPASEQLYLRIEGFEADLASDDDPMGVLQAAYGAADNWGDGTGEGWRRSTGRGTSRDDCPEVPCFPRDFMGFEARWRITRTE